MNRLRMGVMEARRMHTRLDYGKTYNTLENLKADLSDATFVKRERSREEDIPKDVSPHDLYAKCKTCGIEFPVGIRTNPRSFATSSYVGNVHKCPDGHVHPYDKQDYLLKKVN